MIKYLSIDKILKLQSIFILQVINWFSIIISSSINNTNNKNNNVLL